ncbi:MAG: hypothetical protein M3154_09560, partial [Candidatus Eremiobacteraeota bacterium]|nr:hypothetical protein [Candidatus Eremiobacteraeota bacterium]
MQAKHVFCALVAGSFITASAAGPAQAGTTKVRIVRSAGTCPASIAIRWTSVQYEGGATMDVTVVTIPVANLAALVSATRKRIE